jgi:uncharacterized RDD family membrane protein YckC
MSPPLVDRDRRYARFPRRLNALSVDALVLILFSVLVFALLPLTQEYAALRLTLAFVWWGVLLLYEPVTVAWFGGTPGHLLLNLRVVDEGHGGNLSLPRAIARFVLKGLLGLISFFSMSFSRKHQTLHDKLTGSTVQIRNPAKAAPEHYVLSRPPEEPAPAGDEPAEPPAKS